MKSLALLCICVVALAGTACAQVTLIATHDTSIYSNVPTYANGGGNELVTGRNGLGGIMRSLIRFDLSSIPAGSTITGVQLKLTNAGLGPNRTANGTAGTVFVQRLMQDWGEGTTVPSSGGGGPAGGGPAQNGDATWNQNFYQISNWTTAGGTVSGVVSASAFTLATIGSTVTWSSAQLTADVQSMLDSPALNFGWRLNSDTESTNGQAQAYYARENGSLMPSLTVTYQPVPEPATLCALALGAAELFRRRLGRKNARGV